jgi:anti-anti-sigma factor
MATRLFSINQDVDGTYLFKGELTIHDLDYLKDFLESSVARSKKVSISMADVEFADTASLQLLVAFKKSLRNKEWKITALSDEMEKILTISGLKRFLES